MDSLTTNLALVSAIKEYPCLYDNNLPAYSKKETTDTAWNEVSNEIGIPAGECKEKWKNLRWGFIRSLRPNPDGSVKKKYYLHDQMEFVLPFIKLFPKHGNYINPSQESDTDEENIELVRTDSLENESIPVAHNIRAKNHDPKQTVENAEILKNLQSAQFFECDVTEPLKKRKRIHEPVTKQEKDTEVDSRRMFLLSLVPEVAVLTEKQMRIFRRKIFQLIDEIAEDTPKYPVNNANEAQTHPSPRFQTEIIKSEILE